MYQSVEYWILAAGRKYVYVTFIPSSFLNCAVCYHDFVCLCKAARASSFGLRNVFK